MEIGRFSVFVTTLGLPETLVVPTESNPIVQDIRDLCEELINSVDEQYQFEIKVENVRSACLAIDLVIVLKAGVMAVSGVAAFLAALPQINAGYVALLQETLKLPWLSKRTRLKILAIAQRVEMRGEDVLRAEISEEEEG